MLAGIQAYYQALIGAARSSLSGLDAVVFIRRLLAEQALAVRAALDRHHAAHDNQHNVNAPSRAAPPSFPRRQLG